MPAPPRVIMLPWHYRSTTDNSRAAMDTNAPITLGRSPATCTVLASSAAVVLLGLTILVAWHAGIESVLQLKPNYPAMQYNTALCFVLIGSALLLRAVGYRGLARTLIAVVVGVSLLNIVQDIFAVDLGIDQLLFKPDIVTATAVPGRMAPHTAVAFILASLAIGLTTQQPPQHRGSSVLSHSSDI